MNTLSAKPTPVWITYETFDQDGNLLDSSGGRPVEIIPDGSQINSLIYSAVSGLRFGEETEIQITSKDAFGDHNPELIQRISLSGRSLNAGDMIELGKDTEVLVLSVERDYALVDANHPFAGKDLRIKVRVFEVSGDEGSCCCGPEGCC